MFVYFIRNWELDMHGVISQMESEDLPMCVQASVENIMQNIFFSSMSTIELPFGHFKAAVWFCFGKFLSSFIFLSSHDIAKFMHCKLVIQEKSHTMYNSVQTSVITAHRQNMS